MAWPVHHNDPQSVWDQITTLLINNGLEDLSQPLSLLLNQAMLCERENYLKAAPWQHSPERIGHANGYKPKSLQTRAGALGLRIPQVRPGDMPDGTSREPWYPSALERGQRSDRALLAALSEMYVQGVSTRKVGAIVEKLVGSEVTSMQVSRATALLDKEFEAWRNADLPECVYVYLDARYEKVRSGGCVRDCAVLIAVGVTRQGKRRILGVSVKLSEAEAHWREFMNELQRRGLRGMELIISDAHPGLCKARAAVWPSVPWQRCQFHLQQNAQSHVPRMDMKAQVASDIRAIFDAPNRAEADRLLTQTIQRYEKSAPQLTSWMEAHLPMGFTAFNLEESHRKRCRTTNGLERLNREIKRRTRVACIFPNEASLLRLVTALLMHVDDEWGSGKAYISMEEKIPQ